MRKRLWRHVYVALIKVSSCEAKLSAEKKRTTISDGISQHVLNYWPGMLQSIA